MKPSIRSQATIVPSRRRRSVSHSCDGKLSPPWNKVPTFHVGTAAALRTDEGGSKETAHVSIFFPDRGQRAFRAALRLQRSSPDAPVCSWHRQHYRPRFEGLWSRQPRLSKPVLAWSCLGRALLGEDPGFPPKRLWQSADFIIDLQPLTCFYTEAKQRIYGGLKARGAIAVSVPPDGPFRRTSTRSSPSFPDRRKEESSTAGQKFDRCLHNDQGGPPLMARLHGFTRGDISFQLPLDRRGSSDRLLLATSRESPRGDVAWAECGSRRLLAERSSYANHCASEEANGPAQPTRPQAPEARTSTNWFRVPRQRRREGLLPMSTCGLFQTRHDNFDN